MLRQIWYSLPFTGTPSASVAVVPLDGMIAAGNQARRALNLNRVDGTLKKAFSMGSAKAVVLAINSPGGAPAQSRMIHERIRQLAKKHNKPVIAHIEDVGASGGYMLATAADDIYADPFAIVGSIGVIAGGFGFPEAMKKVGVERRIYTAGTNKSQLDPFREEDPEDIKRLEGILGKSHELFIDMVKTRRGGRLKGEEGEMFSGAFWIAGDAAELGLIDGCEGLRALLERRFGSEVKIKRFDVEKTSFVARALGAAIGRSVGPDALFEAAEARAYGARFEQR